VLLFQIDFYFGECDILKKNYKNKLYKTIGKNMSVIKKLLLLFSFLAILHNIQAQENEAVQIIDHPNKNEYILQNPGSDKHKYGYELKDNKHFHHTTTEEDGVRLGCYGHVLEGKKYSTQYVADIKGYRPVYTYDAINVYPRSGGVREASFIGNFDEDQKKSENIRYFFPEGCKGGNLIPEEKNPMANIVKVSIQTTPPNVKKTPAPPTQPAKIYTPKPTPPVSIPPPPPPQSKPTPPPQNNIQTPPNIYIPPAATYLPPASTYLPPHTTPSSVSVSGKFITKIIVPPVVKPTSPPITPVVIKPFSPPLKSPPLQPVKPQSPIIVSQPSPPIKSNCEIYGNCLSQSITIKNPPVTDTCDQCCSADESALITIPIKLSSAGKSGSCASYAKLVIPADSISAETLKSLITNPSEVARNVLKSLA
jgi:hypothetical protein